MAGQQGWQAAGQPRPASQRRLHPAVARTHLDGADIIVVLGWAVVPHSQLVLADLHGRAVDTPPGQRRGTPPGQRQQRVAGALQGTQAALTSAAPVCDVCDHHHLPRGAPQGTPSCRWCSARSAAAPEPGLGLPCALYRLQRGLIRAQVLSQTRGPVFAGTLGLRAGEFTARVSGVESCCWSIEADVRVMLLAIPCAV